MDRVIQAAPQPWILKPGGWATAQFDMDPDHWYFRANRTPALPFAWLLEIALQPCGWLAAYMGSALKSSSDLRFRNLGGEATILRSLPPEKGTLTTRVRLTQTSGSGDMIIEHYQFQVLWRDSPVYEGTTYFGFFTPQALADQKGIQSGTYSHPARNLHNGTNINYQLPPLRPLDPGDAASPKETGGIITMPGKALTMVDIIDTWDPQGGPHGLGYFKGCKTVDPEEWFFKAHFYQDPVCPGSLGLESFLQLLRYAGIQKFKPPQDQYRVAPLPGMKHKWTYRGQILSTSREITVEGAVSRITDTPHPVLVADGILQVDGLVIYAMENLGVSFEGLGC
jgi:3-hydroxymyristoyl/3-hydroxydecanoyl-(acyl carrier protein) dehydratase